MRILGTYPNVVALDRIRGRVGAEHGRMVRGSFVAPGGMGTVSDERILGSGDLVAWLFLETEENEKEFLKTSEE